MAILKKCVSHFRDIRLRFEKIYIYAMIVFYKNLLFVTVRITIIEIITRSFLSAMEDSDEKIKDYNFKRL